MSELNRQNDEVGLYPDIDDDTFLLKLLAKREFRESKQEKITNKMLQDDVCSVKEFEYTPVQRFVSQFMSPSTPYNGMLLYHGVGVGKTCTAILTAEAFLELSPKNKVYILAPPAIQAGFYRTIFDTTRLKIGEGEDEPNQHDGCTANRYLELSQTFYERDRHDIEVRVNRLINRRYSIMGYVAFRNMIRDILSQIPSTLSEDKQRDIEISLLKRAFSGSLIIVDEAHNMRDALEAEDDQDDTLDEKSDASGGKKLAPHLKRVLDTCDGIKLLLMTATPMYNNYKEIISLLNFLLHADHADESKYLNESHIQFTMTPEGERLTPESEAKIIRVANGHVSFMRGENPRAFPARLNPPDELRVAVWPDFNPTGTLRIEPLQQKQDAMRLPLVKCELVGDSLAVIQAMTEKLVAAKGIGIRTVDSLLQAGNCVFPNDEGGVDGRTGSEGFQRWFTAQAVPGSFEGKQLNMLPQYALADPVSNTAWMTVGENMLGKCSPKFNRIIKSIIASTGISFVYSRFVENGAVIFCLLLEANGYTPFGRSAPLLKRPTKLASGRQCAKCHLKEVGHPTDGHKFTPAFYALLTASTSKSLEYGELPLSPNNQHVINVARGPTNTDGSAIKVIVGSQVAGEGLDLKAIRDVHILEGWFHLSKEEQIVGRGIRYCSHQGLPLAMRNCTVSLYVNTFPAALNKETIDLYTYRTAMNKAVRVGNVSRALKQGAADCNLNREAILVSDLASVEMVNSLGKRLPVDLNDQDYTPICDWIRCSYQCKPQVDLRSTNEDTSTYDIYAARFAEQSLIAKLKKLFKLQVWYRWEDIQKIFRDIPKTTLLGLLVRIVNNTSIIFTNGDLEGHIIYKNDLFLFQPKTIQDAALPLALRYGRYPIKRDSYEPVPITSLPQKTTVQPKKLFTIKSDVARAAELGEAELGPTAAVETGATVSEPIIQSQSQAQPQTVAAAADTSKAATAFWLDANKWIDTWAADGVVKESIIESIPNNEELQLGRRILQYVEGDSDKKADIELRLKKLQWWGRSVVSLEDGLRDLRLIARQYIWDTFIREQDHYPLIKMGVQYTDLVSTEEIVSSGSISAVRVLRSFNNKPEYICENGICDPARLEILLKNPADQIIKTEAHEDNTAAIYGFMAPLGNKMIFKTNTPVPNVRGKKGERPIPRAGLQCANLSTVSVHRDKLVKLGETLSMKHGVALDLTESELTTTRRVQGAPNMCALLEIVLRWMDVRGSMYGNRKFFYRPMSAYYSGHRGGK